MEDKKNIGILLKQKIGASKTTARKTTLNTIKEYSTNSHASFNRNNKAVTHKPTKKGSDSDENASYVIGESFTKIDPCNSSSKESNASSVNSNDSADSNNSLCQWIKARVRAQRAWIKSQNHTSRKNTQDI